MINQSPTGGGGEAKINRAINQIKNAQRLIASLPKRYYEKSENNIEEITRTLKTTAEKIQKELLQEQK